MSVKLREAAAAKLPQGALESAEFMQDVGDATAIYDQIWTEFKQA